MIRQYTTHGDKFLFFDRIRKNFWIFFDGLCRIYGIVRLCYPDNPVENMLSTPKSSVILSNYKEPLQAV